MNNHAIHNETVIKNILLSTNVFMFNIYDWISIVKQTKTFQSRSPLSCVI